MVCEVKKQDLAVSETLGGQSAKSTSASLSLSVKGDGELSAAKGRGSGGRRGQKRRAFGPKDGDVPYLGPLKVEGVPHPRCERVSRVV